MMLIIRTIAKYNIASAIKANNNHKTKNKANKAASITLYT